MLWNADSRGGIATLQYLGGNAFDDEVKSFAPDATPRILFKKVLRKTKCILRQGTRTETVCFWWKLCGDFKNETLDVETGSLDCKKLEGFCLGYLALQIDVGLLLLAFALQRFLLGAVAQFFAVGGFNSSIAVIDKNNQHQRK